MCTIKIGCKRKLIESCFNEGILLAGYQHERILTPIGVAFDGKYPMIILPLIVCNLGEDSPKGDLHSYLRDSQIILSEKELITFALQISEG